MAREATYAEMMEALRSPCASYWIRDAAEVLADRDPVDAIADAEHLLAICQRRLAEVQTPPRCGHSVCRQNWIDTAETDCVAGQHDG